MPFVVLNVKPSSIPSAEPEFLATTAVTFLGCRGSMGAAMLGVLVEKTNKKTKLQREYFYPKSFYFSSVN